MVHTIMENTNRREESNDNSSTNTTLAIVRQSRAGTSSSLTKSVPHHPVESSNKQANTGRRRRMQSVIRNVNVTAFVHDDNDEQGRCHQCLNDRQPPAIAELILYSTIIEAARQQTCEDPLVRTTDVCSITERLQPREPQMSINDARSAFQHIVQDIIHSSSEGTAESNEIGVGRQCRPALIIEAVETFVNNLLHHCDRELFLREYFGLSKKAELFYVDIRRQIELIQQLSESMRTNGIEVGENWNGP